MAIKSAEGIRTFFALQSLEVDSIKTESRKIPGKSDWLITHQDSDLAESICDSIALKIHGIYTGIESVLKNTAKEFDGYIPEGDNWHSKLLVQMSVQIGDRNAVVSQVTKDGLNNLRSFRHFLRNDYGAVLDQTRIVELGKVAVTTIELFERDWVGFQAECLGENSAKADDVKAKRPGGCSM
ncbi:hypothetical protein [Propionivibrio sp.]|uniref:ribonuclease toxin HepT-like protein n=1 Tax=Propionivibrio sp. TaxID=2212460 RepID=UPI003BF0DB06